MIVMVESFEGFSNGFSLIIVSCNPDLFSIRQRGLLRATLHGVRAPTGGGPAGVGVGGACPRAFPLPAARPPHRQY